MSLVITSNKGLSCLGKELCNLNLRLKDFKFLMINRVLYAIKINLDDIR